MLDALTVSVGCNDIVHECLFNITAHGAAAGNRTPSSFGGPSVDRFADTFHS